ncbi:hypothetical protein BGX26_001145 [Mortierella sp. AD094]|nr:hypothetical protein BGX26_001145 [Mortierella sp. AD094]
MDLYCIHKEQPHVNAGANLGFQPSKLRVLHVYGMKVDTYEQPPAMAIPLDLGYSESLSDEEKEAIEKHLRYRHQQLQVYDRLANFTQLKFLEPEEEVSEFREVDHPTDQQQDTEFYQALILEITELSLASGLGRLAGLKNPEVFGLEGVDERIGEPELEWMAMN